MPANTLGRRVVEVCLRELGSVELAKRLGVTPVLIEMWRVGQVPIPEDAFMLLIDVLLSLGVSWDDWDKTHL